MRGHLINPFIAEIAQLDTVATAADPDGAGTLTSGFDDDFREVVRVADAADPDNQAGVSARQEKTHIYLPCQVETEDAFDNMRMFAAGNVPQFSIALLFHFRDLENAGLVHATTGSALLENNDRLVAIRKLSNNALVESIPNPPGLFATRVMPRSFGLSGGERNLLLVTFEDREQGLVRSV